MPELSTKSKKRLFRRREKHSHTISKHDKWFSKMSNKLDWHDTFVVVGFWMNQSAK